MAKSIKGTKTEKNLLASFAGESQARNRYTYFASAARKEGFEQIANIFLETAENEKEHAKIFLNTLRAVMLKLRQLIPPVLSEIPRVIWKRQPQVKIWNGQLSMLILPKLPEKKGFSEVARSFEQISKVEMFHEKRYRKLIANIANSEVFKKKTTDVALHQLRLCT